MSTGLRRRPAVNVLLVDDDPVFADTLALRLGHEPAVRSVTSVHSSSAARECLTEQRPDVVLLDYNLDDASSLDLLADIVALPNAPLVLILSGSQEVADIAHAIDLGAAGWLVKGAPVQELFAAVDRAMAGDLVLPEGGTGRLVRYLLDQLHHRGSPGLTSHG